MQTEIVINEFMQLRNQWKVLDVRTPLEFDQGHIPGAENFPLMSNEDRAVIGTIYKQSGQFSAVLKAYGLLGPAMAGILKNAQKLLPCKKAVVYCWRGGMRSESMAWLLHSAGFEVKRLAGGYKSYRAYIRQVFGNAKNLCIVGGKTGSGKTEILCALKEMGEQVVDLEGIASHKGSAFGHIGMKPQSTNEQFENRLAEVIMCFDPTKRIWLEDESKTIGKNYIPDEMWQSMFSSPLFFVEPDKESRLDRLVRDYAAADNIVLQESLCKISEKLGGDNFKKAIQALDDGDLRLFAEITLQYYDKAYLHSLGRHNADKILKTDVMNATSDKIAELLISKADILGL